MNKERFRGVIFGKYKTIKEFSDAIGWNRNKTSRFLNGVQEPNSEEMRKFAEFFQLSPDEFIEIFFENQFTTTRLSTISPLSGMGLISASGIFAGMQGRTDGGIHKCK